MLELTRARSAFWLLSLGAVLTASCGRALDEPECNRLLDRYTEALVREETPGVTPEIVAREQEEARALARRDPRFEFSACPARISRRSYECAMKAGSVDEIERCLIF